MLLDNGVDILDKEFDLEPGRIYSNIRVILTRQVARIEGTLAMKDLDSVWGGVMVVAFPTDESLWLVPEIAKSARVEDTGRFTITHLKPGREYFVASCVWPCPNVRNVNGLKELSKAATRQRIDRPGRYPIALKR